MGMIVKTCEICGKTFVCKSKLKIYCSAECKLEASKRKREKKEQICWRCQRELCDCSWMKSSIPVDGWDADPVIVKDKEGDIRSFKIKYCPNFIEG